jgi:hypothetical protein
MKLPQLPHQRNWIGLSIDDTARAAAMRLLRCSSGFSFRKIACESRSWRVVAARAD